MMTSLLALIQGAYFFVTGLWPILHLRSFMKVTGPKTDIWLVKTMGGVLAMIGATLLMARARRGQPLHCLSGHGRSLCPYGVRS